MIAAALIPFITGVSDGAESIVRQVYSLLKVSNLTGISYNKGNLCDGKRYL